MKWSWISFLAAVALLARPARLWAGPPFFTDDPEPVELRHWEVYLASQQLKTADGWAGTGPHVEVNYGAAPDLQLHVIAPASFVRPPGGPTAYGYGDMELGAKYRFVHEGPGRPQVGAFPLVEAPTGDSSRGLGTGRTQLFLPLWLQKSWGPWTSYGGGGYWFNPGAGNKNWVYAGWLLQRDLSKSLTLGGELFHRTPSVVGGEPGTGFTGGGQLNFGAHYHLLFSAGRDFSGPDLFTGYLGLQWTS